MEAINSPAGKIAQAMFNDPRKNGLNVGQGFPSSWLDHVREVLVLPGDLRRHTLVILFRNLNWFYAIDPVWTETNLLPLFDGKDTCDRDAAWSGFLWGAVPPNRQLYMRLKEHMLTFATNPLPSRSSYIGITAGMLLAGWGSFDEETGERCVSNNEMHTLLLNVDDEFRSQVLWQAEQWSGETIEKSNEQWAKLLPELLRIWPRQISVKSPNISIRFCELAFSNAERFPLMGELILPLLTKIERGHLMLPELHGSNDSIVDRYPRQTLAIFCAVLPDDTSAWPNGIEAMLRRIGEADKTLNTDERLINLKRKWDAR
jgi:hypothetical protein